MLHLLVLRSESWLFEPIHVFTHVPFPAFTSRPMYTVLNKYGLLYVIFPFSIKFVVVVVVVVVG